MFKKNYTSSAEYKGSFPPFISRDNTVIISFAQVLALYETKLIFPMVWVRNQGNEI